MNVDDGSFELGQRLIIERAGPLDRQAEGPRPNRIRHTPKSPTDPKDNRIVLKLLHAEMVQKCSRVVVHIGPRILNLAKLLQDIGDDLVADCDQFAEIVVLDVLVCELLLVHEAGVGVPQDCVAVAGDYLA